MNKNIHAHNGIHRINSSNKDDSKILDQHNIEETNNSLKSILNTPAGSHNIIVYSDMQILRRIYPVCMKSLLNNEIVLVLTYYDHPSIIRQILEGKEIKNYEFIGLERHIRDGYLVIVDSLLSQFNTDHYDETNVNQPNFLSLIRILLNHSIENNKNGVSIFLDTGVFFHYGFIHSKNYNLMRNIFNFEKSIPTRFKEFQLKMFCLYHQKDYESHFRSTQQKAQLLRCHGNSVLAVNRQR